MTKMRLAFTSGRILRSSWTASLLAIAATLATVWLRLACGFQLGDTPLLVLLLIPIMLSAYVGGLGPGLVSTAVAGVAASYYLLAPLHSFATEGPNTVDLVGLLFVGTFSAVLVTSLKAALRKLNAATSDANELRMALDQHAIVALTDPQGKITFVNERFCANSGYSRDELIGQDHRFITSGHHSKDFIRALWTTISHGTVWHGELKNRAKGGTFYWVDTTIVPFLDALGTPRQYLAIGADITERKHAEATLRDSEERYRDLFDSLIEGFCTVEVIFDGDGKALDFRYLEVNPAFEKQTGLHDVQGKLMRELAPDNEDYWAAIFGEVVLTGVATHFENEAKALGRYYDLCAYRLGAVGDRRVAILFNDITERKQAEKRMQDSEERFRTMANSMSQLAWMARPDGFISWYNQRWFDYTGTTPEEMEGWGWQSVHDPAELPRVVAGWTSAITAEETFEMDFPLRRADGRFRRFLTRAVPLKDAAGQVVQWFGTNTDITAQKEIEDALRAGEARYRSTLDSILEACQLIAFDWTYLYLNDAAADHNRRPNAELFGKKMTEAWPGIEATGVFALLRRCMLERIPLHDEVAFIFPDGGEGWFDVRAQPVPEGIFVLSINISERRHAEEEVRRLNLELERRVAERTAQLEAANKELEAFSYSVSHDLRAPLRGVHGFVSILTEDYSDRLDANGVRLLGVVASEAKRMGHLIDDLLAFSRIGRQRMGSTIVDMTTLARDEFENLIRAAPDSAPRFDLRPLPAVYGDLPMLRQVFANLLGNAIKYSRNQHDPTIEVGSRSGDDGITFYVKDNGVGFDERYRDKLFGVFQRLHSEAEFEGTGVGLALVQRIIHRHGGAVGAEAKLNEGATFSFTVPTPTKI